MSKIALGTVQFGLAYGINNARGKVPLSEVDAILTTAGQSDVDVLDTAYDYGDSELVIGEWTSRSPGVFKVVTKLPDCTSRDAEAVFKRSLERLRVSSVYGLLIHHFNCFENDKALWDVLKDLKRQGKVQKIGFSLYHPRDLQKLFDNAVEMDLVQVPYSVFDRRFEPYFEMLKDKGVEVHVRSVFLQGLMFKQPEDLQGHFLKFRPKIEVLQALSQRTGIPLAAIALNFAVLNKDIDKVVLGVDSLAHLESFMQSAKFIDGTKQILNDLKIFQEDDEQLILPMNWKKTESK